MDTRFYQAEGLDIERIARDAEGIFRMQGYQVQHFGNAEQVAIQLRMGSDFEAVIGMQAALTLTLRRFPRGVAAVLGQQQWVDKAAAGALGMLFLWPLALTAGVGVIRQASLEGQVFSTLDGVVLQQRPNVHIGAVPPDIEAQWRQQGTPPPPPPHGGSWQHSNGPVTAPTVECTNCHEMNEAEDFYCSHCGKPLKAPKKLCPVCKAEVKASADFCTKCGAQFAR